ncbi:hypothetical protein [Alteribacter keqinensis]|uniref:Uncharacterized protein n=1 Tax=Alteribacter keqinensis TaxID=2483800 RepID=A0A3M7TW58_9BACI|nr:hypothetical protein [Alteribacter keqinensis]RNA69713.1 hypothetical protein EBO34_07195 [Alteribacter keqinensis]
MKLATILSLTGNEKIESVEKERKHRGIPPLQDVSHESAAAVMAKLSVREKNVLAHLLKKDLGDAGASAKRESYLDKRAGERLSAAGIIFHLSYENHHCELVPREWKRAFLNKEGSLPPGEPGLFFWNTMNALNRLYTQNVTKVRKDHTAIEKWVLAAMKRLGCIDNNRWNEDLLLSFLHNRFDDVMEQAALFSLKTKQDKMDVHAFIHGTPLECEEDDDLISYGVMIPGDGRVLSGCGLELIDLYDQQYIMDLGNFEMIIPSGVNPGVIWHLLRWGSLQVNPEVFSSGGAHVIFTKESVQAGPEVETFFEKFRGVFIDPKRYEQQFARWINEKTPVKEKGLFHCFHIQDIHAAETCTSLLDKKEVDYFSLQDHLFVSQQDGRKAAGFLKKAGLLNESKTVPKVQKKEAGSKRWTVQESGGHRHPYKEDIGQLPRQWFSLLGYDKTMLLRLLRQALIMEAAVLIEDPAGRQSVIEIESIHALGEGRPYFHTLDEKKIQIDSIERIAFIHPDQLGDNLSEEEAT